MHQDTNNTSSVWLAPLWPTGASTFQKKIPPPAEFNTVSARMPDLLSAPGVPGSWGLRLAAGQKGGSETEIPSGPNAKQALRASSQLTLVREVHLSNFCAAQLCQHLAELLFELA